MWLDLQKDTEQVDMHLCVCIVRQATVTFSGPDEESLSGIALESGSALDRFRESFSVMHGQATATL